jgi:hypothetical protein
LFVNEPPFRGVGGKEIRREWYSGN